MVSFTTFVILALLGGSLGDSYVCRKIYHELCDYTIMPDKFPETIDELRHVCSASKTIGRCLLENQDACPDKNETTDFTEIVNFLEEACEEDSSIFQTISNNIKCVEQAVGEVGDACSGMAMFEKLEDDIYAIMEPLIEAENDIGEETALCLLGFFGRVACPSITIGIHCGPETRDAVREILENMNSVKCSEEVDLRNEEVILYNLFEKAILKEHNLRNALEED